MRDCVLHIAWKTYTRYNVYGKCDCVVIARGKKKHGIMYIGKKWNAKVRNYNLRGSVNEMTKKILNFIEKKRSGWQVAPLRR